MAAGNELINAFLKGQQQMTGVPITFKERKEDVFYNMIPSSEGKRCAGCIHFEPVPGTKDGAGTCDNVNGIIDANAWCDLWQKR